MRTTVTLEDRLERALRKRAAETRRSFRAVLNEAVERGLGTPEKRAPFRQRTFPLGGPEPGIDLDRALALADAVEDREIVRKLAQRK